MVLRSDRLQEPDYNAEIRAQQTLPLGADVGNVVMMTVVAVLHVIDSARHVDGRRYLHECTLVVDAVFVSESSSCTYVHEKACSNRIEIYPVPTFAILYRPVRRRIAHITMHIRRQLAR